MTVTFCGHREIFNSEYVREQLKQIISILIKEGADRFLIGGYGGFDYLVAKSVAELKEEHYHIQSILAIPYPDREYDLSFYDFTLYPPLEKVPAKLAIVERNRWMVENSDIVITYVNHSWGGAAMMLEYAKKKKKPIINIVDKKFMP